MPTRKRSTAATAKRAVDLPRSAREPSKPRRANAEKTARAKAPAKRATRAPREKTFRIPELEDPPTLALAAPPAEILASVPRMPFSDLAWSRTRDILHVAHDGLGRSLAGELERIEAALADRLRDMSERLDASQRETARLRGETARLRDSPLDIVFADLRAQIDAVHSPGAS